MNMILTYSDGEDKKFQFFKLIVHKNGINIIEHIKLEKNSLQKDNKI